MGVNRKILDEVIALCLTGRNEVRITDEQKALFFKDAYDFSNKMEVKGQANESYAKDRNAKPRKLPYDQLQGKIAERFVAEWFKTNRGVLMNVDYDVYESDGKRHSEDLICEDTVLRENFPRINVKSCIRNENHMSDIPKSYVFQLKPFKDSLLKKSIVEQFEHVIACVFMPSLDTNVAYIYFVPWRIIRHRKLLYDPVLPEMIGIKTCLYEDNIMNLTDIEKDLYCLANQEDDRLRRNEE